ncbi:EKC/KEOPS complex subunit GON7-like [Ptychodera flava]|uniref:EKC/KEOPS complex subunit GON7-like n=1 Tax=Ptychodera flava TaxID=63121 RepID=UPI00396A5307
MATPMLSAVLTLKSGEQREISYPVGAGGGKSQLKRTHESLKKLQEDVNSVLTELVEEERKEQATDAPSAKDKNIDEEDEDEDEDDSEDEDTEPSSTSTEPEAKKQRSE